MDESTDQSGIRRLDAATVNEMAQALNDGAGAGSLEGLPEPETGAHPISSSGVEASAGIAPAERLESEEREQAADVFPPDIDPNITVGGSAEEQSTLREEYNRG